MTMYEYLFEIVEWSVMARAYLMQWVGKNTSFFFIKVMLANTGVYYRYTLCEIGLVHDFVDVCVCVV